MKFSLLVAASLFTIGASAQMHWAKTVGGPIFESAVSNAVDANGNVYTTGIFMNTVDFDPGAGSYTLTAAGQADVFVTKTDVSGNFMWAAAIGSDMNDESYGIAIDAAGNSYVTGFFNDTCDFDPGAGTFNLMTNIETVFVLKLDNNGNLSWAKQMETSAGLSSAGFSIALDPSGNVFTAGQFDGTVDFDPGAGTKIITSMGGNDAFVSKLDANGNFVWADAFHGAGNEEIRGIAIDGAGYPFIVGGQTGMTDFDPDSLATQYAVSLGATDIFIVKLTPTGILNWVRSIGGASYDMASAITTDQFGNIYVTGYYIETVDFDPSASVMNLTGPVGAGQTFVLKLTNNSNYVWAQTAISTISGSEGTSIGVDQNSNVYVVGVYIANAATNGGASNLPVEGGNDSYFAKYNSTGNFLWANHFGSSGNDGINDIAIATNGDAYTAGYYTNTGDLDPTTTVATFTSNGGQDAMMHRFGYCVLNGDVTYGTNSITAVGSASSYQWIDCATSQPVAGATSQTFFPTVSGSYQVQLIAGSCSYTSTCSNVMLTVEDLSTPTFHVYPNPTNGAVTIQLNSSSSNSIIEVFNATGQLVNTENPLSNSVTVELPNETGIYLIRVTVDGASTTQKVIKE